MSKSFKEWCSVQVDGVRNPKIQSIYLDNFAITQAAFAAGGSHVIATARRKHFYTFDLASASVEKVRWELTTRTVQSPSRVHITP